jgi:2-polyprenyl-6-methoxyphenol hydroxylase-like FAD-dependent oxidoreductase
MGTTERYLSIPRSELAAVIYDALCGGVELILNDTVQVLADDGEQVRVTFESGQVRDFDLVVGADGLHSRVRRLAFGPDEQFESYLNIVVAVFDIEGYRPRNELIAMMHAEVGFQAVRVSIRDDITMVIFTVRHDGRVPTESVSEQQALLCQRLADAGWETPAILAAMPQAKTFYFHSVSQIRMPSWTRGRVALVGDARRLPLAAGWSRLRPGDGGVVRTGRRTGSLKRSLRSVLTLRRAARAVVALQAGCRTGLGPGVRADE